MSDNTVIDIDMAKSSFHVCVVNAANEVVSNKAMRRRAMENRLVRMTGWPCDYAQDRPRMLMHPVRGMTK